MNSRIFSILLICVLSFSSTKAFVISPHHNLLHQRHPSIFDDHLNHIRHHSQLHQNRFNRANNVCDTLQKRINNIEEKVKQLTAHSETLSKELADAQSFFSSTQSSTIRSALTTAYRQINNDLRQTRSEIQRLNKEQRLSEIRLRSSSCTRSEHYAASDVPVTSRAPFKDATRTPPPAEPAPAPAPIPEIEVEDF
eukprot:gnl/Dysnectes_brevis/1684_a1914_2626.p1 GENE.gnl/Dysnectes_brevis/1684_a1914_2626~~gnl/Dysnectes_brevis/1684_a1914_2626.p1  ORF type:complete len:195 (-),score=19.44 gnl/Dysnectes_brevis/1684_a1914_2626:39-623(-)